MTKARDLAVFNASGVLTSTSNLNATNLTSGTIPNARYGTPTFDGSNLSGIAAGGGKVLNVVSGVSSTTSTTSSSSYQPTNIAVTIQPSASSSKVFLTLDLNGIMTAAQNTGVGFAIYKTENGTTSLVENDILKYAGYMGSYINGVNDVQNSAGFSYLHSSNSTNTITYKVYMKRTTGSSSVKVCANNQKSSFIAMEIAA